MLSFLANNIEQLDLALEHIALSDANNARFGLMLTDNIVEITLHQLALDRQSDIKNRATYYEKNPFPHERELTGALRRHFDPKVKFAIAEGKLSDEEAESITALHNVRNEVYHVGVRDNVVLPAMARFYFHLATTFLGRYTPRYFSWGSSEAIPVRAARYFHGDKFFPGGREDYPAACAALGAQTAFDPVFLVAALADRLDRVIEQEDAAVDILSQVPHKTTRDLAVTDTQAWAIAFTEEGKKFMRARVAETGTKPTNFLEYIGILSRDYPFAVRRDPIPSWQQRASSLRAESNPHKALKKYRDFMDQTEELRALLDEAHSQADAYVEEQIDRAREERALREDR